MYLREGRRLVKVRTYSHGVCIGLHAGNFSCPTAILASQLDCCATAHHSIGVAAGSIDQLRAYHTGDVADSSVDQCQHAPQPRSLQDLEWLEHVGIDDRSGPANRGHIGNRYRRPGSKPARLGERCFPASHGKYTPEPGRSSGCSGCRDLCEVPLVVLSRLLGLSAFYLAGPLSSGRLFFLCRRPTTRSTSTVPVSRHKYSSET